jgi:hypothetical protein
VVEDDPEAAGTGSVATTTTTLPADADAGLELIADELAALSGRIAGGDGDNESIALVVAAWGSVRSEVEAARPELIRGFDATIAMAEQAVERTRPADADKASANLAEYLDNYYGRP